MKRSERKRHFAECGRKRKQYRLQIRGALLHNGQMETDIARQLSVAPQMVCMVIGGVAHSQKVLQALREAGVPEAYLHDPRWEDHHAV